MEGKNPQESIIESKLFKIPIDKYEEDMDTELAKGKKNEILDLLNNSNHLRTEKEFKEIEYYLHDACEEGDVDLIKIYLSETINNDSNGLQFKIDSTNRTASLFKINKEIEEFFVPRTVEHGSIEYLITSICGTSLYLKTLKFVEDSAVKTIYEYMFPYSSRIREIYIPTSLKELKDGWCCYTYNLSKIKISPSNGQFKVEEDKYLIGKSDPNKDEFDTLLFACRDIEEISIPPNIKIISSFAFQHCKKITKVEIPTNSNLQIIKRNAFSEINIKTIFIPSKVSKICKCSFLECKNLTKVEIPTNSNLQTIGRSAFWDSNIKSFFIPSNVSKICYGAFSYCTNLTKVEIPTNSNLQTIESNAFSSSKIKSFFIPSNVSKICYGAFQNCKNLTKIVIPPNSNLQTIESNAFSSSKIKSFFIPSNVSTIFKDAFSDCFDLQIIEISEESKMKSFQLSNFGQKLKCIIMISASLEKLIQFE